ncbi:MAG TPA: M20/M25/M40 family metallo-hydrolase [Geothrix sp.]|nr:M20/M25/M40 family metallo-hydrolase [Geothrix sp.]
MSQPLRRQGAWWLLAGLALGLRGGDLVPAPRAEPLPPALQAAVERLDAGRMARHMAFLTDPDRQGRGLGTAGLDATVRYLAGELDALGLDPLQGARRQAVPLRRVTPGGGHLRLRTAAGTLTFRAGRDLVLPPLAPGVLDAPVVFAGHGIQEPALGHDDFRGLDVRGKVVVFLSGCPPGHAWERADLLETYASPRFADRYDARLALLEKLGARAAIALEDGLETRLARGLEPAQPYFLAAPGVPAAGEPPLARVALSPELRALLPTLKGRATLAIRGRVAATRGFNVLGKLEGSDPALKDEAILIGAHMDHLGLPGGVLHPGADDNASGVSALLEISRVLAASPVRPRRTILLAFWTGEEEGKFGSGHYTRHPRWPLAKTRAYLNLDMIGHPWTRADLDALAAGLGQKGALDPVDPAHFAEPGPAAGHRDLGPMLVQAGAGTGMALHLDWTDGRHGGSDYRDFARRDVPFVRFFGSYFPGYHTPADTLDQLDPAQVRRMARLVLASAWLLADR